MSKPISADTKPIAQDVQLRGRVLLVCMRAVEKSAVL